jgi:ornithine cyclodeaminase
MLHIEEAVIDRVMDWSRVVAAIRRGHLLPKPELGDVLLGVGANKMLTRAAWIAGLGAAVKSMTVFPDNVHRKPYVASIQGLVLVFDKETGSVTATLDGAAITRWKTAGDSALGADLLARRDAETLLMVGAGTMSEPLIRAHIAVRPSIARIVMWNRTMTRAESVAARLGDLRRPVTVTDRLEPAVREADIVSCATMTKTPIINGDWLKDGAHLDLIGAYNNEMREADDVAIRRARVFVDFRGTTIGHIGEITIPLRTGVIRESDVLGDLYDLVLGRLGRRDEEEVTLFKNGGGAHLDLMTSLAVIEAVQAAA